MNTEASIPSESFALFARSEAPLVCGYHDYLNAYSERDEERKSKALMEFYELCLKVQAAATGSERPLRIQPMSVNVLLPTFGNQAQASAPEITFEFNFSGASVVFQFPLQVFLSPHPAEELAVTSAEKQRDVVHQNLLDLAERMEQARRSYQDSLNKVHQAKLARSEVWRASKGYEPREEL